MDATPHIGSQPQPFIVGNIAFESKAQAREVLSELDMLLLEVEKATPYARVSPLVNNLQKEITSVFDKNTQSAVRKGVTSMRKGSGDLIEADVKRFMKAVEKDYEKFPLAVQQDVARTTGLIYDIQRKAFAKQLKIKPTFKLIDTQAKAFMAKDQMWWIGDYYDANLSSVMTKRVSQVMLDEGLGRADAAKKLQKTLRKDIMAGRLPAKVGVPPPGWNSTPQAYFEALSGNMAARASSWSALESMVEAGVEVYRIAAVIDSRTSSICRLMNGKTFTVQAGVDSRSRIMAAKTPLEVRKIAGWQRAGAAADKYGIAPGKPLTPTQSSSMAADGMALPPYHFRCRTTVLSSGITMTTVTTTPQRQMVGRAEEDALKGSMKVVDLPGRAGSNVVNFYRGKDADVVFKPISGESKSIRRKAGITDKKDSLAARERAAYIVDRGLGQSNVPTTVIREIQGKTGSTQRFIKGGRTGFEDYGTNVEYKNWLTVLKSGDVERMQMLDYLIYNVDRHLGNVFFKGGKMHAIDNSFSFIRTVKGFTERGFPHPKIFGAAEYAELVLHKNKGLSVAQKKAWGDFRARTLKKGLSKEIRAALDGFDVDAATVELRNLGINDDAIKLFRQRYQSLVDHQDDGDWLLKYYYRGQLTADGTPWKMP